MLENIDWKEILESLKINTTKLVISLIMIIVVLLLASLAVKLLSFFTTLIKNKTEKRIDDPRAKTTITLLTAIRSVGRYAIYFIAICIIINGLGYGSLLSNIVTAAGVGALVISLGAQSVISDVIAGTFILFENQYRVGDYVQINNEYTGTVLSLAMRCTYLQTWKGEKIIIPNGQIKTVTNYSGEFNMAIVDIPTPYEEDSERILNIIKDIANKYYDEHLDICFEKPNVVAINSFDSSSITMTIYQKAKGRNHITIQRDLKLAVKKRFDQDGISIPYNQIVVHNVNEEEKPR